MTKKKNELLAPMEFDDLSLIEVKVTIKGEPHILREASAGDARSWRANTFQSISTKETGRGKKRISQSEFNEKIANSHLLLVSLCLFKLDANGGYLERYKPEELRSWPNHVIESLFIRAKAISELDDVDEEGEEDTPAKNEQETSEATF